MKESRIFHNFSLVLWDVNAAAKKLIWFCTAPNFRYSMQARISNMSHRKQKVILCYVSSTDLPSACTSLRYTPFSSQSCKQCWETADDEIIGVVFIFSPSALDLLKNLFHSQFLLLILKIKSHSQLYSISSMPNKLHYFFKNLSRRKKPQWGAGIIFKPAFKKIHGTFHCASRTLLKSYKNM